MSPATRLGIGTVIVIAAWAVAYWLTDPPSPDHSPVAATPAPAADPDITFEPPITTADTQANPITRPDPAPRDATANADNPNPAPPLIEPSPGTTIIPPVFDDYTVQSGDTPDTISRRFYGTRNHWDAILRANPTIDFHKRLRVGMTIRIPRDPTNIQGKAVAATETIPVTEPVPVATQYTVQPGDTLSEIAKTVYGSAALWTLIRDANIDKTGRDGTRIRPGMALTIPARPAR